MSKWSGIKGVLLDLSGTLHIDDKVTPKATTALNKLRQAGVKVRFVTNSTKTSDERLYQKLVKLGFDLKKDEIWTSLSAAKRLVQRRNYRPLLLLEDTALEQFEDIDTSPPHNAVVVGLAPSKFNYYTLNQAFRLLLEGKPLVGIHKARYFASAENELSMGPGGFVTALEYAAGVKSELVGKPQRAFYELSLREMGLETNPESVAMIGDDVRADLGDGAEELGLKRILVRTGKYRHGDEDKASSPLDGVFDTFSDAVDAIVADLST